MNWSRKLVTTFLLLTMVFFGGLCTQAFAYVELTDSAGFTFYIDESGSDIDEGDENSLSDAYDGVYYLYVEGTSYSALSFTYEDDNRELVFPVVSMSGLDVSRKMFVPTGENFVRILNILHNPTADDITIDLSMDGNLGSDDGTSLEATSSGDLVLNETDRWMVTNGDSGDPRLAHLWDGRGGADAVDSIDYDTGGADSDSIGWTWSSVTVPAGETVIYMTFGVMQSTVALAQTQAETIDNYWLNDSMIGGMSALELESLMNWDVSDDDNDGMIDGWETFYGLNLTVDDSADDLDDDGLSNGEEFDASTDPSEPDTDGDGLSDFDEVMTYETSPISSDTDNDGYSDYDELAAGHDPLDDSDGKYQTVATGQGYVDQPNIAVDAAGDSHMVWIEESAETNDYREVYYQLISLDGTVLIDRTMVSDLNDDDSVRPAVAAGPNGQVLVSWHEDGGVLTVAVLDVSLDDQDGSAADMGIIKVVADDQIASGMTPDLAVNADGGFYIAYTDYDNSGTSVLKMEVSAAPGYDVTYSGPTTFSPYSSRGQPRIRVDSQDHVHLLWNDSDIYYALIDGTDGSVLFDGSAAPILTTPGGGSAKWQDFDLQEDGRLWITWRDNSSYEIYYTVLDIADDGGGYALTEVLEPTLISVEDDVEARYPDCLINAAGNLRVVWYEGGESGYNATLIQGKLVAVDGSVVEDISNLVTTSATTTYWTLPRLFPLGDSFSLLYRKSGATLGVYLDLPDLTPLPAGLEITDSNGGDGVNIDFGQLDYDVNSDITITLTNTGSGLAELGIDSIAQIDILEDPFAIVSDECTGASLASGEACDIVVQYAPTLVAAAAQTLPMYAGFVSIASLLALGAGGSISRRRRLLATLLVAGCLCTLLMGCDSDNNYVPASETQVFTDSFDIKYTDASLPSTTINVTGSAQ